MLNRRPRRKLGQRLKLNRRPRMKLGQRLKLRRDAHKAKEEGDVEKMERRK